MYIECTSTRCHTCHPPLFKIKIIFQCQESQTQDLSLNSDALVANKIDGPISIAKNNFVSTLDYSDNFEVSFEYKASTKQSGLTRQHFLIGSWLYNIHFICIGILQKRFRFVDIFLIWYSKNSILDALQNTLSRLR